MRTSRIALTALALATSLTLASCAGGSGSPSPSDAGGEPQSGGTLTYLAGAEPPVWDGQRIPSLGANSINSSIFDTLIAQDEDGGYQPNLATDW